MPESWKPTWTCLFLLVLLGIGGPAFAGSQKENQGKLTAEDAATAPYIAHGAELERMKDYEGAIIAYSQAVKKAPANQRPLLHAKLGELFNLSGESTNSLFHLTLAILEKPRYFEARMNRARLCLDLKLIDQALIDLTAAVDITPDSAEAHYQRARTLMMLNRVVDAYTDFLKAHQLDLRYPKPTLRNAPTNTTAKA